jgi:hypothetical protein
MKSYLSILFRTQDTFSLLQEKTQEDLDFSITVLLTFVGITMATESFFKDRQLELGLFFSIMTFLFICGITLLIGKFVISYLLWGLGTILKGNSKITEIQMVVAYSFVPKILMLPIILYFGIISDLKNLIEIEKYISTILLVLLNILAIRILIIGIMKFNKFGLGKALVNVSPIILIATIVIIYQLMN